MKKSTVCFFGLGIAVLTGCSASGPFANFGSGFKSALTSASSQTPAAGGAGGAAGSGVGSGTTSPSNSGGAPGPAPSMSPSGPALATNVEASITFSTNNLNLQAGQQISFGTGKVSLTSAGDLQILNSAGTVLWHSATSAACGSCKLTFQNDGDLVLYGPANAVVWSSGTPNNSGGAVAFSILPPYLAVTDQSNKVLYSQGSGVTPVMMAPSSANDFLNSLGICIHYAQGVSMDTIIDPLKYIGVRNVRDDFGDPSGYLQLHQATGIKVNLLANTDLNKTLTDSRTLAQAGALLSLEGPNEANNFPITYNGQSGGSNGSWMPVAQFQRDLYAAVKADSVLGSYPVLADSEAAAETSNVGLQFLTIPSGAGTEMPDGTKFADYANPHNYVSGTANRYVDNQAWSAADPNLNSPWDGLYVEYEHLWGRGYSGYSPEQMVTLPRVTTETGWDSVGNAGGERVQGTVLLNVYFAQFRRGWHNTFIYMLRDGEGGDGNQGVFNHDSSPKLAATYIHNMTTILADQKAAQLTPLAYAIANRTLTVHDLLLQKSSGAYDLVVWDERVSSQDSVTVQLQQTFATVTVYDPTVGTSAVQTLHNVNAIPLTLSDHPVIIELSR